MEIENKKIIKSKEIENSSEINRLSEINLNKELARESRILSFFPEYVKDPNLQNLTKENILKKEEKIILVADLKGSSEITADDVGTEIFVNDFNKMLEEIEKILEENDGQAIQYTGDGLILEMNLDGEKNKEKVLDSLKKIHQILNSNPKYKFRIGIEFGESNKIITKNMAYVAFGDALTKAQDLEKNALIEEINIGKNLEKKLEKLHLSEKIIFQNESENSNPPIDQFSKLEAFLPQEIVKREEEEHRSVSTAFIKIKHAFNDQERIINTLEEVKKICDRYSAVLKINNYDDGIQMMIYSGLSDNSKVSSIIKLGNEIRQNLLKNNFEFNVGLSSGKTFVKEIGNDFKEILVTGKDIVKAARLAQSEHNNEIIMDKNLADWLITNQAAKLETTQIKVKAYNEEAHILKELYAEQYDENILFNQTEILEKLKSILKEKNNSIVKIEGIKGTGNDFVASILHQNKNLEYQTDDENPEKFIQIELNPWSKDFKLGSVKQIFSKLNLNNEIEWSEDLEVLTEIIKDYLRDYPKDLIISIVDGQRLDSASAKIIQEITNDNSLNVKLVVSTHREKNNEFKLKENYVLKTKPLATEEEVIDFIVSQTNFKKEVFLEKIDDDNKNELKEKINALDYLTPENLLDNIKFISLSHDCENQTNQWLKEVIKNLDNLDNLNQARFSSLGENSNAQKIVSIASCLTMGNSSDFNNQTVINIAEKMGIELNENDFQILIENNFLSKQDFNKNFKERSNKLSSSMADYRYRHLPNDEKIAIHEKYLEHVDKKANKQVYDYSAANAHLIQKLHLREIEYGKKINKQKLLEEVLETFQQIDENADKTFSYKEFGLNSKNMQLLIDVKKKYLTQINRNFNEANLKIWNKKSIESLYFAKGRFDYANGNYTQAIKSFESKLALSKDKNIRSLAQSINGLIIVSEGENQKETREKYLSKMEELIPQLEENLDNAKNEEEKLFLLSDLTKYTSTIIGNRTKAGAKPISLQNLNKKNVDFVNKFEKAINNIKISKNLSEEEKKEKNEDLQFWLEQLAIQKNNIADHLMKLGNQFEKSNKSFSHSKFLEAKKITEENLEEIESKNLTEEESYYFAKENLAVITHKLDLKKDKSQHLMKEALELAIKNKNFQAIKEIIKDINHNEIFTKEDLLATLSPEYIENSYFQIIFSKYFIN